MFLFYCSLYPPNIDWRSLSLDVQKHPNFDPLTSQLDHWEIDVAKSINLNKINRYCQCHISERIQFKYFIMGLNLLLMFLVYSNNALISFTILDQLQFAHISAIAVFLPRQTRLLLAKSTHFMNKLSSNNTFNIHRLRWCLRNSAKQLLLERSSLTLMRTHTRIDVLHFSKDRIEEATFNPVYPILSLIFDNNILFVYCYGKKKRSKDILYFTGFAEGMFKMSWSSNGRYMYISTKETDFAYRNRLFIYSLDVKTYTMTLIHDCLLSSGCFSRYLWISENELLYKPNEYILKKIILSDSILLDEIKYKTDLVQEYQQSDILCVPKIKNTVFFYSDICNIDCLENHGCIYQFNYITHTLIAKILVPGKIQFFDCNSKCLVYGYTSNYQPTPDSQLITSPDCFHCPFANLSQDAIYTDVIFGIYDGTHLQNRNSKFR